MTFFRNIPENDHTQYIALWNTLLECCMPESIMLAMAISLLFGHDAGQFVITGHTTFTSKVLPV